MTSRLSRYSHHARRAIAHAANLAEYYRHPVIDTSHLLVGVLRTEGSIGYDVLHQLRLDTPTVEVYLKNLYPSGEAAPDNLHNDAALDEALELAIDEANWLGHHYVGTEHLLLGITRTNAGEASKLLTLLDVSPGLVRRRVRLALNDGKIEYNLASAKREARLSELAKRVVNAAEQLAVMLDHPTVGLGHLLMVMLNERRSPVSKLLKSSGLDDALLKQSLSRKDTKLLFNVEMTLRLAFEQAERMGNHYTGTEHLLLVLTVEPAGVTILRQYGIKNPELVRARVEGMLKR